MPITTHADAVQAAHRVAAAWAPGAVDRDRAGATEVPHAALQALDTSGLLAITVPTRFGGPELGPRTLAEVTRVLAAVDPALAQVPQGHFLLIDVLAVWGSDAARDRLFAAVLAGERLGNALAERGGKHAQDLTTAWSRRCGRPRRCWPTRPSNSTGSDWSRPTPRRQPGDRWRWRRRNARTHSVHDPLDWKYHHVAAYELGDVLPPNHGQL